MSAKASKQEQIKKDFLGSLLSLDKDQISEFINQKGKEPKKIKPFICLPSKEKEA